VEAFCLNDYTVSLAKGDALGPTEKARLTEQLHMYTSLPRALIKEQHFRIDWMLFTKNLLKDNGLVLGRMNSTISGLSPDPTDAHPRYDPSLSSLYGPFSSAMNAYVREELRFQSELFYEFLNPEVIKKWNWSSGLTMDQGFVDFSHTLKELITIRRDMKVFVARGIYDLATPYFTSTYTLQHMWLGQAASNIVAKDYHAGHMIYTHDDALISLFGDVRDFYAQTLTNAPN
jgi:carboxypeptidase C (cathepsin A)